MFFYLGLAGSRKCQKYAENNAVERKLGQVQETMRSQPGTTLTTTWTSRAGPTCVRFQKHHTLAGTTLSFQKG